MLSINNFELKRNAISVEFSFLELCGSQAVYSGDKPHEIKRQTSGPGSNIEDPSLCFSTIAEIQHCIISLEQEHIQYMRSVERSTVIGSMYVFNLF